MLSYDEFVNEGLYKFMTTDYYSKYKGGILIPLFFSVIVWIVFSVSLTENDPEVTKKSLLVASMLDSPMVVAVLMRILRNYYDKLRSVLLLGKSSKEYKKAEELITKYPDIKKPLSRIKLEMRESLKNRDKRRISKCIHDIYELSKDLKIREKNSLFFDLDEDEKKALKEREALDPLGEEQWEN